MVRAHLRSIYPPIIIIIFLNKEKSGGADAGSLLSRVQQTLPKGKKIIIINTERRKKKPQYQKKKKYQQQSARAQITAMLRKGARGAPGRRSAALRSAVSSSPTAALPFFALRAAPRRPAPPRPARAGRGRAPTQRQRRSARRMRREPLFSLAPAGAARHWLRARRDANEARGELAQRSWGGGGWRETPTRRCAPLRVGAAEGRGGLRRGNRARLRCRRTRRPPSSLSHPALLGAADALADEGEK